MFDIGASDGRLWPVMFASERDLWVCLLLRCGINPYFSLGLVASRLAAIEIEPENHYRIRMKSLSTGASSTFQSQPSNHISATWIVSCCDYIFNQLCDLDLEVSLGINKAP